MLSGVHGRHLAVGTSVSPPKPPRTASCRGIHSFLRHQAVLPRLRPLSGITRWSVSRSRSSLLSSRLGAGALKALHTCSITRSITCPSPLSLYTFRSIRRQVIPAARRDRAGLSPAGDDDSPEQIFDSLPSLSVAELKQYCQHYSLTTTGRKADLVARLEQYLLQLLEDEVDLSLKQAAPAPAAAGSTTTAGESFSEIDLEELILELEAEFAGNSKPDLVAALQSKGLPTDGNKAELVTRLAAAVARDELDALQAEVAVSSQQQPPLQPQQQPRQQPPLQPQQQPRQQPQLQSPQPPSPPQAAAAPADREWLIADKQQVMLDELLQMGVKREELVEILAEMGHTAAEDETLEDLAERASWVLAEEEVLLMEQQSAADAAATGTAATTAGADTAAASPSNILDGLTATDVNKMKVGDLKATLHQLGLSDEGTRYMMRDRLMTMMVVRRAATAGDMDQLLQQLSQMTLSELRAELERRGLSLSGTKAALEMRLAQTLVSEIMGEDAAAAMQAQTGEVQEEEEVESLGHALLEEYDETETAAVDPAVTVALICGVAPATTSQSSISSAAKLRKVTEALATASTLLDELHTAPLDPEQAVMMEAGQQAAVQAAADGDEPPPIPVCGMRVDVYWADTNGIFYQLEAITLCGTAPADLAFRAPALAVATFHDAAALAQHMASAHIHAALSVLPGGALAMSGELATACEAAGTPLAAGAPGDGPNKVLSERHQPVLGGRAAVLQELRTLGYPTLPMLEVSRQEMLDQALELAKYLDKALTSQEEAMMVAAQPDSESLVDDSDSVSGGNRTSAILRDWNQRSAAADEEPAEEASAVEDSEQQQEAEEDSQQQQEQQHLEQLPQFLQRLAAWCAGEGMDPDLQLFTMGNAAGGEPLACAKGLERVVEQLVNVFAQDDSLQSLLIEPFYRKLVRWEAVVVSTAEDGPVSLVPAEVEHYNVLQELEDADLALKEWQMMQASH